MVLVTAVYTHATAEKVGFCCGKVMKSAEIFWSIGNVMEVCSQLVIERGRRNS